MAGKLPPYKKISTHDWPAIISAWQASGSSQKAFCREQGITYSQFKYHYYGVTKQPALSKESNDDSAKPEDKSSALFAPIKVTEQPIESCTEIRFPSGVIIKVPAQTALLTVMKALSAYL